MCRIPHVLATYTSKIVILDMYHVIDFVPSRMPPILLHRLE